MACRLFVTIVFFASFAAGQTPVPKPDSREGLAPKIIGGEVLPPKLISSVEPKYPRPLFHKPKPSIVLVRLTVAANGIPTDVHVIKSGGTAFDKAAIDAVSRYRFQPSTVHGEPVSVLMNVEVHFQIF